MLAEFTRVYRKRCQDILLDPIAALPRHGLRWFTDAAILFKAVSSEAHCDETVVANSFQLLYSGSYECEAPVSTCALFARACEPDTIDSQLVAHARRKLSATIAQQKTIKCAGRTKYRSSDIAQVPRARRRALNTTVCALN